MRLFVLVLVLLNSVVLHTQSQLPEGAAEGQGEPEGEKCDRVLLEVELNWAECTQHEQLRLNSDSCILTIIEMYKLTEKMATGKWPPKFKPVPSELEEASEKAEITKIFDSHVRRFDKARRLMGDPSSRIRAKGREKFFRLQLRMSTLVAKLKPNLNKMESLETSGIVGAGLYGSCGHVYYNKLADTDKMKRFISGCVACLVQQNLFPATGFEHKHPEQLDMAVLEKYHELLKEVNTALKGSDSQAETQTHMLQWFITQNEVRATLSHLAPVMTLRLETYQSLIQKEADDYHQNVRTDTKRAAYFRRFLEFNSAAIARVKQAEAMAEAEYRRHLGIAQGAHGDDDEAKTDDGSSPAPVEESEFWARLKQVMKVALAIIVFIISFSMVGLLGPLNL